MRMLLEKKSNYLAIVSPAVHVDILYLLSWCSDHFSDKCTALGESRDLNIDEKQTVVSYVHRATHLCMHSLFLFNHH